MNCYKYTYGLNVIGRVSVVRSSLKDWLVSEGTKQDEIKLNFGSDGETLFATANSAVKKDEILLSIPVGLTIDEDKAVQRFGGLVKSTQLRTGQLGLLALFLLVEKSLSESSKFSKYIKSLGTAPPGILSWDISELNNLTKSTTRTNYQSIAKAVKQDVTFVQRLSTSLFPPTIFNEEGFIWALGMVKAHAVLVENRFTLVPGKMYN